MVRGRNYVAERVNNTWQNQETREERIYPQDSVCFILAKTCPATWNVAVRQSKASSSNNLQDPSAS